MREAPSGFDDDFFAWLSSAIDETDLQLVSGPGLAELAIDELARRVGTELPVELREFYRRANPWTPRLDWEGWDDLAGVLEREAPGYRFAPLDCRNYGAGGSDRVVAIAPSGAIRVLERVRSTGRIEWLENTIRDYLVAEVQRDRDRSVS